MNSKKIYFASDLHLGLSIAKPSIERERLIVQWLETIRHDAAEIFLLGDIFDFWHEYRYVIPKGFVRFQGVIASITDSGIPVHFFSGNHDVWMYDYFAKELGVTINHKPVRREFNGKTFFLGHGDGLGQGDRGYKLMKWAFCNPLLQWLFAWLHPNIALWLGTSWSNSSRSSKPVTHTFRGEDELITSFARMDIKREPSNYYIFGHWHAPVVYPLTDSNTLVLLGDWIENNTYGVWDGNRLTLRRFCKDTEDEVIGER